MPDPIVDLALRTASTPAVGLDLDRHLSEVCSGVVRALRVTGAVVVVLDPAGVHGSDGSATLIGRAQQGTAVGPVAHALRSGQPLLTPDLLRVGPPTLVAAAADCGLVCSGVLPLVALSRPVGALQLLGVAGWVIENSHLDRLAPLAGVLAAQLANVAALTRSDAPARHPGTPIPRVQPPSVPTSDKARLLFAPAPRPRPAPTWSNASEPNARSRSQSEADEETI